MALRSWSRRGPGSGSHGTGPRLAAGVLMHPMEPLSADVVVIGSGMGGATTALALARRGADVLILERGRRLPREPENASPRAVFLERRDKPAEQWSDARGRPYRPRLHYVVRGDTKGYGASPPRVRARDLTALEPLERTSPAW